MTDLTIPLAIFGIAVIAFGIFAAIKTDYVNDFLTRMATPAFGERTTERLLIRATKASALVLVVGGVGVLAIVAFILPKY